MIVLHKGEYINKRKEARITIKKKDFEKEKYILYKEGKGTIYVTDQRIVFEDALEGIIFQLTRENISSYRVIEEFLEKKVRINFIADKNNTNGLVEITCKDCSDLITSIDSFIAPSNSIKEELLIVNK
ncbi:MAG: hypothetical protein QW416_00965 [Candidatus Nitrosocaldaceae archaeon]